MKVKPAKNAGRLKQIAIIFSVAVVSFLIAKALSDILVYDKASALFAQLDNGKHTIPFETLASTMRSQASLACLLTATTGAVVTLVVQLLF